MLASELLQTLWHVDLLSNSLLDVRLVKAPIILREYSTRDVLLEKKSFNQSVIRESGGYIVPED